MDVSTESNELNLTPYLYVLSGNVDVSTDVDIGTELIPSIRTFMSCMAMWTFPLIPAQYAADLLESVPLYQMWQCGPVCHICLR